MEIDLLLAQLKFVDHLSHGDFVYEEVFDALETASDDARRTIIRSLEDIVDLTRHNDVVQKLMWVKIFSVNFPSIWCHSIMTFDLITFK